MGMLLQVALLASALLPVSHAVKFDRLDVDPVQLEQERAARTWAMVHTTRTTTTLRDPKTNAIFPDARPFRVKSDPDYIYVDWSDERGTTRMKSRWYKSTGVEFSAGRRCLYGDQEWVVQM